MNICVFDVCLAALALYLLGRLVWRRNPPFPPGPPGWPLIGNLFDFPTLAPYKTLGSLRARYGHVVSMNMMGTRYVVLNSFKAVSDILEKKGSLTADRPSFTMASDLVGLGSSTGFLPHGEAHRKHRKFFHQQIGTKSSLETFYPAEEAEAKQFVRNVVLTPDDLPGHARKMAGSVILTISHGYGVKDNDDPLVVAANRVMRTISIVTSPGQFLVDFIPTLQYLPDWLPGCRFLRDAKKWRNMLDEAVNTPHKFVLERMARGDAFPSFSSRLLREGMTSADEELLKWASFSMYLGGSDTTPSALCAFFLAMTMYPDTLKKAQAEIDAVVGCERLPTMQDRALLTYVDAICKELMRWNVVVPLAMHVSTQDILYDGYFIPKGTYLLGNIWFILSNPATYPDPDKFNPERFLGENQQPNPFKACFGWGRRMCPGALLAETSIFVCIATALATLDILRGVENGKACMPKHDVEEGTIRYLKPFRFMAVPRSEKAEDLLFG